MLRTALWYLARHPMLTLGAAARDPRDLWARFYDDLVYARERRVQPCSYDAVADWEMRLHGFLGTPWPCATAAECSLLWPSIISSLSARGIRVGPESYLYWNDGDPALIRAIWCLVRHLRPQKIVETGVAHGVSSRFILEALEKNGSGGLWSIDLPPLQPAWQDQVGIAVEGVQRRRWSLIRGSSRQRLAPLLSRLEAIDLFIHDSLHSERNVRFELDQAWAALKPGGAMVVDDIDANSAFRSFTHAWPGHFSLVCEAEPFHPDRRRFNEKGLFGIILKEPLGRPAPN
jgi:hypothetical protein